MRVVSQNRQFGNIWLQRLPRRVKRGRRFQSMDGKGEYKDVSKDDLIARITDLEHQLSQKNNAIQSLPPSSSSSFPSFSPPPVTSPISIPIPKKPKTQRPFAFSRYEQQYVAFKFAYLGWPYNGLAAQDQATPLPTVEEELFKALMKTKLIQSPTTCNFSRCGRTDKGVSAMGQVIALNVRSGRLVPTLDRPGDPDATMIDAKDQGSPGTRRRGEEEGDLPWLETLNGALPPSIRILAICTTLLPTFSARFSCLRRHYKYFFAPSVPGMSGTTLNLEAMREACHYLVGEHDFRNFSKLDASKQIKNFKRTIIRAELSPAIGPGFPPSCANSVIPSSSSFSSNGKSNDGCAAFVGTPLGLYVFDLEGSAFLWHQVRCITALLLLIGQNLESPTIIRQLQDITKTPRKPVYDMADDWPLVLYDCIFDEREVKWAYPANAQRIYESAFATFHEARIKDCVTSLFVGAARAGVTAVEEKGGVNLGDGKLKISREYIPLEKRRTRDSVEVLNANFARKKAARGNSAEAEAVAQTERAI